MRSKLLVRRTSEYPYLQGHPIVRCPLISYLIAFVLDSIQLSDGSCLLDIGKFE
jgi:hypothetical protein